MNVELVYIILKSITQFAYLNSKRKADVVNMQRDESTGDATLLLSQIKVKNSEAWSGAASNSQVSQKTVIINTRVRVTFYRMQTFMDTFKDYFQNFEVLHQSLSPKFNRDMVFKAGEGAGRSGSFFFFSHDRKFIIKTMTEGELKLFLKILPDLAQHYKTVPDSLLAKKFGVFTVKRSGVQAVHIMLMENTLRLKNPAQLKYIFDLKGSLVDRKVKGKTKASTTLKDVNFLMAAARNKNFTKQTRKDRILLRETVRRDVEFLRGQGLMDYSLLLGIEVLKQRPKSLAQFHLAADSARRGINGSGFDDLMDNSLTSGDSFGSGKDRGTSRGTLAPHSSRPQEEHESVEIGEMMSRKHCFVNGNRVYHFAIIDYL